MAVIHACECLQAMLLTSFLKLVLASPDDVQLRVAVENILDRYSRWVPPFPILPSSSCKPGPRQIDSFQANLTSGYGTLWCSWSGSACITWFSVTAIPPFLLSSVHLVLLAILPASVWFRRQNGSPCISSTTLAAHS